MSSSQIGAECLANLLEKTSVRILDGSWALDGSDMQARFQDTHIPSAQFFDLEAISDHSTDLPHMAPSPEQFARAVGNLGISAEDHIVIYDQDGLFSAARVWWTFRLMGHPRVQVLKGGLPAWIAAGLPVSDKVETPAPVTYLPQFKADMIMDLATLKDIHDHDDYLVFDARSKARFHGTAPEPRQGLRSGHIPKSQSLPFAHLLADGQLKPVDDLKQIFKANGLTDQTAITTCGSGVTAAILALALSEIGYEKVRLYDGSWSEWGKDSLNTPVTL